MTKRRMPARLLATGSVLVALLAGVGLGSAQANPANHPSPCVEQPCLESPLYIVTWEFPPEAWLRVELSRVLTYEVTFTATTVNGVAVAPEDYERMSMPVTIPAGRRHADIPLRINPDRLRELPEDFYVVISSPPPGVGIANDRTQVTIMDGPQPALG
jgi:Calx-beta domain-containing protein